MKALRKVRNLVSHLERRAIKIIGGQEYLTIQIDITNACNLSCAHCYHANHSNSGAIKLDEWKTIIDQYFALLKKVHCKPSVVLCGGEPTISPLLLPVINYINLKKENTPITILTNGTKLTPKLLSFFKRSNISFQVSIDGANKEDHDKVRGTGSFEQAKKGINEALINDIAVSLLVTLSQNNSDKIIDFFKLGKQLGVNAVNFTRLIPEGNGKKLVESKADKSLIGTELKKAYEDIIRYSKEAKIHTNTNKPLFNLIDKNLGANAKFGFQGIVIDYKGNMKVSSRINMKLGNVLTEGLEELFFKSPIMKQLRKGNIEECGKCPHYSRCGGDRNFSFAMTGSFLKGDSACWITKTA